METQEEVSGSFSKKGVGSGWEVGGRSEWEVGRTGWKVGGKSGGSEWEILGRRK